MNAFSDRLQRGLFLPSTRAFWFGMLAALAVSVSATIFWGAAAWQAQAVVFVFPLLLAASVWLLRRQANSLLWQRAWELLGAAAILLTVGALLLLANAVTATSVPRQPALGDLFLVLASLLAAAGLLRYPLDTREDLTRLRIVVDVLLSFGATLALGYQLTLRPLLPQSLEVLAQPGWLFWGSARIVVAWVLVAAATYAILRSAPIGFHPTFGLLASGLVIYAVSDAFYTRALGLGTIPTSAHSIGRQLGLALAATAVWLRLRNLRHDTVQSGTAGARWLARIQYIMPLVAVLALFAATLVTQFTTGSPDPLVLLTAIVLSAALVVRQGILFGESQLRRYAQLVNSTSDANFVCRQDGRVLLANPAASRMAGLPHGKTLVGQRLDDWLTPDITSAQLDRMLTQAWTVGWRGEVTLRHQPGDPVTLSLVLDSLRDEAGSAIAIVGTARDVTDRTRTALQMQSLNMQIANARDRLLEMNQSLERLVAARTASLEEAKTELERQNRELLTLDTMKSDFVSLVSHELRTPLNNINGGIEMLLSQDDGMSLDTRESLFLMQQQARRLTDMVTNILDLSAYEAGRMPVSPQPLALRDVLPGLIERFPPRLREGLTVAPVTDDIFVLADKEALANCIVQLINNAHKYAPDSTVAVTTTRAGDVARIAISDHGPGVPPTHQARIFDRFHRAHASDDQAAYGYGLGLYSVRLFVEAMNGAVGYNDTEGGGATFWIALPLAETSPTTPD